METGRNAPCPCGSGKKYKHCCLQKNDNLIMEPLFKKIYESVPGRYFNLLTEALVIICPHAFNFMPVSMDDPMDESFYREIDNHFSKYHYDFVTSLDYLVFDQLLFLESDDKGIMWIDLIEKEMPDYFSEQEKDIIRLNAGKTNLSLFEVINVVPGESLLLKDLFTGEEYNIIEHSASRQIQKI